MVSSTHQVRRVFDRDYYQRFYENPRTRAATVQDAARQGRFVATYLRYLEIPVHRILDLGCGLGRLLGVLGKEYPRARCVGVEWSEHLCERFGYERGSVVDYVGTGTFDLVVCHDVIQYLSNEDAARALGNLARLTRGALLLGVLTTEDWKEHCDQARTDDQVVLRTASWYRRRLNRRFVTVGGGLHLKRPTRATVWSLDRI